MKFEKKTTFLILILCLMALNAYQYKNYIKLNKIIDDKQHYAVISGTRTIPKEWVLPALLEENIDISRLYQLHGYLIASDRFIYKTTDIAKFDDIHNYLWQTIGDIEKLIKLIESNSSTEEIRDLTNNIVEVQLNILKTYHPDLDLNID